MSRSSFARKFKETVGASPIDYLTCWRMLLAGDRLANSNDPISVVSLSLGYESESAFSTAFKGSWAVRRGNIAVAGIWFPLRISEGKPGSTAGSDDDPPGNVRVTFRRLA